MIFKRVLPQNDKANVQPARRAGQRCEPGLELLEGRIVPSPASDLVIGLDTHVSHGGSDWYRIQNTAHRPITLTIEEPVDSHFGRVSQDQTFRVKACAAVEIGPVVNVIPSFTILSAVYTGPVANAPVSDLKVQLEHEDDLGGFGYVDTYAVQNSNNQGMTFTVEETWTTSSAPLVYNDIFLPLQVAGNSTVYLPPVVNVKPTIQILCPTFIYSSTVPNDPFAPSYTVINLGDLGGRSDAVYGTDINDAGQVVGTSRTAAGDPHAFLYQGGTMTDLGTLGGNDSYASAINNAGQIVGEAQIASGDFHAFLYQNGAMTDLGTLGGTYSAAFGINDMGQIVGEATTPFGHNPHAFLYQAGKMTNLGTLGGAKWSISQITSWLR